MELALLLRRNNAFAALSDEEIAELVAEFRLAEHRDGHLILREDAPPGGVFMVVQGTVEVVRRGLAVNRLPPGALVGLMALVDGGPRSASVRAVGPVIAAHLSRDEAEALFRRHGPIAFAFQRAVAKQLAKDFRHLSSLVHALMASAATRSAKA